MAKREARDRTVRKKEPQQARERGDAEGSKEERTQQKEHKIPKKEKYFGRTIGDTATSYSSVGGSEEPDEWPVRVPEPDDNAPDYETPGGAQPEGPETASGPVHDVSYRPAPGGYIEEEGHPGRDIPFTGEVTSTRGAPFDENPYTGKTPEEEEEDLLTESLEERTRRYESG
ncbi:MAG: hypothetical protein ACOX87_13680 [Chloroflexota bacterium]|jgi:hypothetical protein